MRKTRRVQARNVRPGDLLLGQLSVRLPQTATHFNADQKHIYINRLKFDPTELVRIERNYDQP